MERLNHNLINHPATVSAVEFRQIGDDKKDVIDIMVELDDIDVYPIPKTFFLTSEKSYDFLFKTLKNELEWWGDLAELENIVSQGGIIGKRCRVTTSENESNGKIYYQVNYINNIDPSKSSNNSPSLPESEKTKLLAKVNLARKKFAIKNDIPTTSPTSTNAKRANSEPDDNTPF